MTWVLILFIHTGALSDREAVTMTAVPGFRSEASCQQAGNAARALVSNTRKDFRFVCVGQ